MGLGAPLQHGRRPPNLGQTDEARALLEKVVDECHAIAIQIGVQPSFGVLKGEPRFQALVERVGLM